MKFVVLIVTALALLTAPAAAQMGGKRGSSGDNGPKVQEGPKVDEKAYKAAMERIPVSKEKYDPWGGVAPAQTPATTGKKK